jgi:hypothetical protein
VKELSSRFDAPIPRRIVKAIKQSAASVLDETMAAASGWVSEPGSSSPPSQGGGGAGGVTEVEKEEDNLCVRTPNHWACRGVAHTQTLTVPSFKVCVLRVMVRDEGV